MKVGMRWTVAAALTTVALALGAVSAGADVEPNGGSSFDTGDDGWQATSAQCSFLGGGELLCDASGERVEQGGNPNGALRARSTVIANAGGLFSSQHVFRSATFMLDDPFDGAFAYERRLAAGQLVALGVRADVTVALVNESTGAETVVLTDALSARNREWGARLAGVPGGILKGDVPYHLEIRVETGNTSTPEEVVGSTDVFFDNIRFVTSARGTGAGGGGGTGGGGGAGGGGTGGGSGGDGGTPGAPGTAPGGSVIKLSRCTMLGTPGDDRIKGTKRHDIICALGGDDVVRGLTGHDVIDGASGNDVLKGGKKGDVLFGVAGRDRLTGSIGSDKLFGGDDRDVLKAGADNDNISARDGERDVVDGGSGKRNRARTDAADAVKRVQRQMG
jgi:Ca2+-binding RTX toxin-like protein